MILSNFIVLALACIASGAGAYWIRGKQHARTLALVIDKMDEERRAEVRKVKQDSFTKGLTQGGIRSIKLTRARLEEEYQTGWKAHEAAMGLNLDLAHRTESQN